MYCYKLLIAYDGSHYSGWQVQPNAPSIQEQLQRMLKIITQKENIHVIGAGRTDAGVHALGQVAHFKIDHSIDKENVLLRLNRLLPEDIRVYSIEEMPLDFHACYSALGKEYHYHLHLDKIMNPFQRKYRWHLFRSLDLPLLKQALPLFVGTHDFTSFANEAHKGSASRNAIRTIDSIEMCPQEGGIRLEFKGNGFLYKMVRNIVGTLVNIASHRLAVEEVEKIFAAKDRTKAEQASPPQGLFLVNVIYSSNIFRSDKKSG